MTSTLPKYGFVEELANSVTHGIGALLAVAGLSVLLVFAISGGDAWQIISASVYGTTLIFLFLASTLYHSIQHAAARSIFRHLDHIGILLLIAGSYTPFTLVTLRGPWGWALFGIVWGIAVLGIVAQLSPLRHIKGLMLSLYLTMGWVVLLAINPLINSLPGSGLILLTLGGLLYTLGVPFYVMKRMPMNHAVWHLFVLAGAAVHYFAILFFVIR